MLAALVQTYNELIAPLLLKGGAVVGVLLVLSIVALAVILIKIVQFYKAGIYASQRNRAQLLDPVLQLIRNGKYAESQGLLEKQRGPLARMLEGGLLASWQNHRRANRRLKKKSGGSGEISWSPCSPISGGLRSLETLRLFWACWAQ